MEVQGTNVPKWTDDEVQALLLLQAARFMGLANLLEKKGLVTRDEITEAVGGVVNYEMPRLMASLTFIPSEAAPEKATSIAR